MKMSLPKIMFYIFIMIWVTGCQTEKNYQAYKDPKKKGEQVFLKDLQACKDLTNQSKKRSEGSEGAGEFLNRRRELLRLCMDSKYWTVKQ